QVGDLEIVGALRQLLDGIAAVAENTAVAVDLGDAADRRRGVGEGWVIGEEAEVVGIRPDLAEIHGADGAIGDRHLVGLARAIVSDGQGVGWHDHGLLPSLRRLIRSSTRLENSAMPNGLARKALAPASRADRRASREDKAETASTDAGT